MPRLRLEALGFLVALGCVAGAGLVGAQVPAEALLRGRVTLGDSTLGAGEVVLHSVSGDGQGSLDTVRVGSDGTFTVRLPRVPDPERSDVYFASIRHHGVLYFGPAVTSAVQLDSVYEIHAYDTLVVSDGAGVRLPVQVRNVFLEPAGDGSWSVTDLFQVRNDEARTLVSDGGAPVWRHPLPPTASGFRLAESDILPGGAGFEDGELLVRSPVPPGERLFVVRYTVPDPFVDLPLAGATETLEVLVREPAPPVQVSGLASVASVELEPGTTYRRFVATDVEGRSVRVQRGPEATTFPVEWLAVLAALALAAVGVWAWTAGRSGPGLAPIPGARGTGGDPIIEIARLDEAFERLPGPTREERAEYARRRGELLRDVEAGRWPQ